MDDASVLSSQSLDVSTMTAGDTPSKDPSSTTKKVQRKSGKRISELQKRFVSSSDVKAVDAKDVSSSPMTRSATAKKIYEHEVKVWLEKQVVTSRDF